MAGAPTQKSGRGHPLFFENVTKKCQNFASFFEKKRMAGAPTDINGLSLTKAVFFTVALTFN